MENLTQVTFLFPGQPDEVRFVESPPSEGDLVASHDGEAWFVVAVDSDGLAFSAFCEPAEDQLVEEPEL